MLLRAEIRSVALNTVALRSSGHHSAAVASLVPDWRPGLQQAGTPPAGEGLQHLLRETQNVDRSGDDDPAAGYITSISGRLRRMNKRWGQSHSGRKRAPHVLWICLDHAQVIRRGSIGLAFALLPAFECIQAQLKRTCKDCLNLATVKRWKLVFLTMMHSCPAGRR